MKFSLKSIPANNAAIQQVKTDCLLIATGKDNDLSAVLTDNKLSNDAVNTLNKQLTKKGDFATLYSPEGFATPLVILLKTDEKTTKLPKPVISEIKRLQAQKLSIYIDSCLLYTSPSPRDRG